MPSRRSCAGRTGSLAVFQVQLTHQQTAVPLTRDYIANSERDLIQPLGDYRRAGADDPC
jgi:hypothetical protein